MQDSKNSPGVNDNCADNTSNNVVKDALTLINHRQSNVKFKQTLQKLQDFLAQTKADNQNLNQKLQKETRFRTLLEDKLTSSEARLRAIFEAIQDIMLVVSIQDNNLSNVEILPT